MPRGLCLAFLLLFSRSGFERYRVPYLLVLPSPTSLLRTPYSHIDSYRSIAQPKLHLLHLTTANNFLPHPIPNIHILQSLLLICQRRRCLSLLLVIVVAHSSIHQISLFFLSHLESVSSVFPRRKCHREPNVIVAVKNQKLLGPRFQASSTTTPSTGMSPSAVHSKVTPPYQRPNLHIHGIGVEYPPYEIKPEHLATLARRFYPSSPA